MRVQSPLARATGAAILRLGAIANASQLLLQFRSCKALLRTVKLRYIKYHAFAFFAFLPLDMLGRPMVS